MRFNCKCGRPECNESAKTTLRFKIFNESKSAQRRPIDRKKFKKSNGSMTDIAKRLGLKIEEDLLTEDQVITESKADQQKFIDKFGKEFFDIFWNSKQRLKSKGVNVDILWHVKNTSLSDMRKILDSISDEQRAKERDVEGNLLPEPTGNYDVVFESDDYIVYHPHDYISSIYCAKGGRWCTAGGYMIPEGQVKVSQAKTYFNQYTSNGIELYYFIRSNGDRYALAVYPNGTSYEVYNKSDSNIGGVENIPGIEDVEIDGLDLEDMRGKGGAYRCDNCGEVLSEDEIFPGSDGDTYCESCFFELFAFCSKCEDIFDIDDVTEAPDGQLYCSSCLNDLFVECDFCNEYASRDEVYPANTWDVICDNCVNSGDYVFCEECNEVVSIDNAHSVEHGEYYCDDCFSILFKPCNGCGVLTHHSEMTEQDGKYYCLDCADRTQEESFSRSMKFRLVEDIAAVRKNYPKISDEDFDRIIRLDPTFVEGRDSVGQYGKWLLNLFNKGRLDNEGHATDCLNRFEEEKKYLKNKDIGRFKSLDEVDEYLNDDENYKDKSHRQEVRDRQKDRKTVDLSKEAQVAYKNNSWTVWVPETYAASCKLGQGTSWCTASTESDHYFKYYTRQGALYIVINNANEKEKYQFHFETASFMNANDESIELIPFLREDEGLFEFFKENLYGYISLDEDDIVDGTITTSVYDENDYEDIFGREDYKFIYSIIGADGDDYEYFDRYSTEIEINNIDYSSLPDSILRILSTMGINSSEDLEEELEAGEEIYEAFQQAYDLAELSGCVDEARDTIIRAIEDAGGEYKDQEVYITITEEELLDNFDEYFYEMSTYEDILKAIFKEKFEFREPYYGWSGFNEEVFHEELDWRLTEVASERGSK